MAIVVESFSSGTIGPSNPATLALTKPTGLSVGDLMLVVISYTNSIASIPTGFSSIRSQTNTGSGYTMTSYYKIADSGDVAASSFSFTSSGFAVIGGGMLRISGFYPTTPIATSNSAEVDGDGTPEFSITVTPTLAESLLVFGVFGTQETDITDHAIATSNPTWSSKFNARTANFVCNVATATRTAITATGNATCTAGSTPDTIGMMIVVNPIQNATVTADVVSLTVSIPAPTIQVGINITVDVVSATVSVQSPTVHILQEWNAVDKNSATFTNQSKSSASFTNVSKNSSSWTNQNKTYE